MLRSVAAIRYVAPLREGGSLPGLMEADDFGTYVVKFTGAGQGRKALIAEVICANLARLLDLPTPELVTVEVDPVLAANEPDDEVQDLIRRSPGTNLGVDFLPGALDLDATAFAVTPSFAGAVLWFDAWIGNVDRSWRNPNMLFWHGAPYLIDHGAALTFQHNWASASTVRPYDAREHALLRSSPALAEADERLEPLASVDAIAAAVHDVPDEWLADDAFLSSLSDPRSAYVDALLARLQARSAWLPALRETVAEYGDRPHVVRKPARPTWLGGAR